MSQQPDQHGTEPEEREDDSAPAADDDAPAQTQEFGHDGPDHYPTEDDPN